MGYYFVYDFEGQIFVIFNFCDCTDIEGLDIKKIMEKKKVWRIFCTNLK